MKYFIVLLLLTGCAQFKGVKMDADEAKACAVETCTVWTNMELDGLARQIFRRGYAAGKGSL